MSGYQPGEGGFELALIIAVVALGLLVVFGFVLLWASQKAWDTFTRRRRL
jgi:hypothetical protein